MSTIPIGVIVAVAGLIVVVLLRTVIIKRTYAVPMVADSTKVEIDANSRESKARVERLAEALRIDTVAYSDVERIDVSKLRQFQSFLVDSYPELHQHLERVVLSDFAVVYIYRGKSETKKPVAFVSHYDVIQADTNEWTYHPFSGEIVDGFVWGRGALDMKNQLMALLEAATECVRRGITPERTIYFAFGGDEERSGRLGAGTISEWFRAQGLRFEWVNDEGAAVTSGILPGARAPVALIGTSEKGIANIKVTVAGESGHTSSPPRQTASGILARACARIDVRPFRARLIATVRRLFTSLSASVGFGLAIVYANIWLFAPLLKVIAAKKTTVDALLRTSKSLTILEGSDKENVLPESASAQLFVYLARHKILILETCLRQQSW